MRCKDKRLAISSAVAKKKKRREEDEKALSRLKPPQIGEANDAI